MLNINFSKLQYKRDLAIVKEADEIIDCINSGEGVPDDFLAFPVENEGVLITKFTENTYSIHIWDVIMFPNGVNLVKINDKLN
jgi:hypothetical protein